MAQTDAQILAQAQAQANAALDPARKDLQQQASEAAQANTAQGQAIIALSQQLAQELGGIAPSIEATYRSAAKDQSAFAAGFSTGLQQIQQQGQSGINADLANIGAPEGQMLKPSPASGDFLFGLGGYLPGQTFSREGAAFTSAAKLLPGTSLLQGQRDFAVNAVEGRKTQKQFERWLKELNDKYPGLLEDYVNNLKGQRLQEFAAHMQAEYLKLALRKGGAEITGIDPATGFPTFAALEAAATATAKKKTAKQARVEKRNGAWDTFYAGVDSDATGFFKETTDPVTFQTVKKPTKTRTQAFSILWNRYGRKLVRLGANRAKVRAEINKALTDAGYARPSSGKKSGGFILDTPVGSLPIPGG